MPSPNTPNSLSQAGVAIVLVVFIVALASILVINLTYSTFISTRTVGMVERGLQAEYLLKSLLNFSQVLIQQDKNNFDAYQSDAWGVFALNPRIPNEYLGITDMNSEIYLELVPTNSRLNISALANVVAFANSDRPDPTAEAFENLFRDLEFEDALNDPDQKQIARGKNFSIRELVGNLIDWQDQNNDSFDTPYYTGAEGDVNKKYVFNRPFAYLGQLSMVPGMTPRRLNALAPYVSTLSAGQGSVRGVNINTASPQVIKAINPDIDTARLQEYLLSDGPFQSVNDITKSNILPAGVPVGTNFNVSSESFDIYAKIKFGLQRAYYLKARILRGRQNAMPRVLTSVIY